MVEFLVPLSGAVVLLLFSLPATVAPAFSWSIPIATVALIGGRTALIAGLSSATLSSTIPLIAFSPLLISITSFFILGELITFPGGAGIVAVVIGSYLLRIQNVRAGLLEPIRVLARERGARMMVLAALCFSVAAPFTKLAIRASSIYVAFGTAQMVGVVIIIAWLLIRGRLPAVLGHLFFAEDRIGRTLVVGAIMVAGVVVLSLG